MLVGVTNSGKTNVYEILKHAMTFISQNQSKENKDNKFENVQTFIMNPKSITMGELYGETNEFTQEWQDGLASQIMRECAMDESPDQKWCVFDGPVDAHWIENMNTVLDDNMMLCLANGQRIKLRPEMRMLFEVQDLAVASPATVSRCGMVYLTQDDLPWQAYVHCWL
jgi:dynein heavy chain